MGNRSYGDGEQLRGKSYRTYAAKFIRYVTTCYFKRCAIENYGVLFIIIRREKLSHGNKDKGSKFWPLKIFFITLLLSGSISLVTEYFMGRIHVAVAIMILLIIIFIGVIFDIIGVAFSVCDKTPFVALASKKAKGARRALKMLKNAASVSNFCNDVIGDVCGIISGAAGAAIAAKFIAEASSGFELAIGIGVSALTAALTVALKAAGKTYAMKNDKKIVKAISGILNVFSKEDK